MTDFIKVFGADYAVDDDPSRPLGENSYSFVTDAVSKLSPAVEISVTTAAGETWHGDFFGNHEGLNVVVDGPSPGVLVAVAAGVGYVVPVASPPDYRVLSVWPVRCVRCAPGLGLVLLADYTDVLALGEGGEVQWEAKRLVSDGFTEIRVESSTVVVSGYVAPEGRDVETTLDLASGSVLDRK